MTCRSSEPCALLPLYDAMSISYCRTRGAGATTKRQFAAIDAHIDHMELPLINDSDVSGPRVLYTGCTNLSASIASTVLAIAATYPNFSNLIVFTSGHKYISEVLSFISSSRPICSSGITLEILPASASEKSFCVTTHETGDHLLLSERRMMSAVSDLTSHRMSIVMYLYPESVGYCAVLPVSDRTIWVTPVSNSLNMKGRAGNRLVPAFYASPRASSIYRVSVGTSIVEPRVSSTVIDSKLNSLCASVLNAVTRDGKCYFCSYMERVHIRFCGKKEKEEVDAQLLGEFSRVLKI